MNEYSQDDIQICIDFGKYNQKLDEKFGIPRIILSSHYDARIVFNHRRPRYISFTVYYSHTEYLFERFQYLHENGVNVLQFITNRPPQNSWDFQDFLDFSNSKLIDIEESHFWELNKKPLIFIIDNLNLLIHNSYSGDGHFQLTENALQQIHELIRYGQLGNHDDSDPFISSNYNREISFGNIRMVLSLNHDYGDDTKYKFEINRDAYLTITDGSKSLDDVDLFELGKLICILLSFYWEKTIDFFIAHCRVNNNPNYRTLKKYRYSNHYVDESSHNSLKSRYGTVYDFIESLDYTKISMCKILLEEIVPRINRSKVVDEISEFMLLYSIVEKIRNYCIEFPIDGSLLEIKEEFIFIKGKDATDNYIKNKIKEIVEIIDPSDKDDFLAKANGKVNFIKKTGLVDQFDSLVTYLSLNPEMYSLDFTTLITIRNGIYHGKPPREDVNPYNNKLRLLINDLVLQLIQ